VQRPLIGSDWSQAVQSEIHTFADADSGCTSEQECIAQQVIRAPEFLLELAILVCGKRSGKVLGQRWEVLAKDQPRL
jgi:hypothetical protein